MIAWARWEVVGRRVACQKWRWTELAVTLGLVLVTSRTNLANTSVTPVRKESDCIPHQDVLGRLDELEEP